MNIPIRFRRLADDIPTPAYHTSGAVAFDLPIRQSYTLEPGEMKLLATGLVIEIPEGHALLIAARSSLTKKNLLLANGIGVIDQDYCGPEDELFIPIKNIGTEPYHAEKHERLAQGLIIPIVKADFKETHDSVATESRGGFGTTG